MEKTIFVHSFVKMNKKVPFTNPKRNEVFSKLSEIANQNNITLLFSRYDLYKQKNQTSRIAR